MPVELLDVVLLVQHALVLAVGHVLGGGRLAVPGGGGPQVQREVDHPLLAVQLLLLGRQGRLLVRDVKSVCAYSSR